MEKKTYITEANVVAVVVVWLLNQLGVDMSGEVAAAVAVSLVGALNVIMRVMVKKEWL